MDMKFIAFLIFIIESAFNNKIDPETSSGGRINIKIQPLNPNPLLNLFYAFISLSKDHIVCDSLIYI